MTCDTTPRHPARPPRRERHGQMAGRYAALETQETEGRQMIKTIHADVETRSPVDLRKQGAFVYFENPDTTVLMMAYRLDDQPIRMWTYDQPCPDDLRAALEGDAIISAFNSQFETLAFDLLADRKGWP